MSNTSRSRIYFRTPNGQIHRLVNGKGFHDDLILLAADRRANGELCGCAEIVVRMPRRMRYKTCRQTVGLRYQ